MKGITTTTNIGHWAAITQFKLRTLIEIRSSLRDALGAFEQSSNRYSV